MPESDSGLLKSKLSRIATLPNNPPILGYITTIITCGGIVRKQYEYPEAFSSFRAYWGEAGYRDAKSKLIEEGIVRESESWIGLNIQEVETMDPAQREKLAKEFAQALFLANRQTYITVLKEIVSTSEGEYILTELAKIGQDVSDDTVHHISQAVGGKYFNEAYEKLSASGLFVSAISGKRHSYYRLFPAVVDFINVSDSTVKNALLFVYIAQNVRNVGFVLEQDCRAHRESIDQLLIRGMLEYASWYSNRGFKTTEKGRHAASSLIGERLASHKHELETFLLGISPALLRFLSDFVFPAYSGTDIIPPSPGWDCYFLANEASPPLHLCLLNDDSVRRARDNLLSKLEALELCVRAHAYVSTGGGAIRELRYVIAPEAELLVREFSKGDAERSVPILFPLDLEVKHRIYHSIKGLYLGSYSGAYSEDIWINAADRNLVPKDVFKESLAELLKAGAIIKKGNDLLPGTSFDSELRRRFFSPLVTSLTQSIGASIERTQPQASMHETKEPKSASVTETTSEEIQKKPSLASKEVSILLGMNLNSKAPEYWRPVILPNPHMLIVGTTGMGKTETSKSVIHELTNQNMPSVMLDPHNEYASSADLVIDVRQGVSVNPLELLGRSPLDTTYEISSILRQIYALGDQQESLLRRAIKMAYENAGIDSKDSITWNRIVPTFSEVRENLLELREENSQVRGVVDTLLNRLEPIFDIEVFSKETSVSFEQITKKNTAIELGNLPTEEVKSAVSDFFLRRLWYHMTRLGKTDNLRFYTVIDEAHRLAYEKSPIVQFLREARKYGVGVILASQTPRDFSETILANVGTFVCLKLPLESDASFMAKQLRCSSAEIQNLDVRGKALVKYANSNEPELVQISPQSKRKM